MHPKVCACWHSNDIRVRVESSRKHTESISFVHYMRWGPVRDAHLSEGHCVVSLYLCATDRVARLPMENPGRALLCVAYTSFESEAANNRGSKECFLPREMHDSLLCHCDGPGLGTVGIEGAQTLGTRNYCVLPLSRGRKDLLLVLDWTVSLKHIVLWVALRVAFRRSVCSPLQIVFRKPIQFPYTVFP